ncbi:MAG: ATP-binding domain-containing protein, partial [Desulfobacterales bacterium]|nr:ATP-binding domain-containing protein [Desulfobacterales bacterium]
GRKGVSELISFLKVVTGAGSLADLGKIVGVARPGVGKETYDRFKVWCFKEGRGLAAGLKEASRKRIFGMTGPMFKRFHDFSENLFSMGRSIREMKVEEALDYILENTRLKKTIRKLPESEEAVSELLRFSKPFGSRAPDFLAMLSLQTDPDAHDHQAQKVSLMTMHAAKGMEFPVVFIVGCEDGLTPFIRPGDHAPDLAEERRLFYVAMTRARERLYLTHAKKRAIHGKTGERTISPFVADIESRLKRHSKSKYKKKKKQEQLSLF